MSGDSAFNGDEIPSRIDLHYLKALCGSAHIAQVTRHFLTLEHTSRGLILPNGSRRAVRQRVPVRGILHVEMVALNSACKSLAD